ncbi:Myristoyl transferase [Candidatus Hydrogenisulfobacillus filiaventi]|uniref:Thiamine pyrimidine synthase n=1 Tax=Candidatus Hydrogenisulfobacillus filiaventi TaxID=2707344 RepID=A0A6F8ZDH9_9FIRM|nr:Myristoyl transferase [Candidatus Hydrogenisulfobacillus filiaventi]
MAGAGAVAAAGLAAAGCGSRPAPSASAGQSLTPVSVQLTWLPQYQFAGYYVALKKGYYRQEGLNVTIHPGGPGISSISAVASGADTFGLASPDQILVARSHGAPFEAILTDFQHSPTAFMVHAGSGIRSPRDFVGKTVAVNLGGNTQIEYEAMLAATGVNPASIHQVPVQVSLTPFLTHRVNVWTVFVTDEPYLAEKAGQKIRLIYPRTYGIDFYQDVLFARRSTLRQEPQVARRFVAATVKGWMYAIHHPRATDHLLMQVNPKLTPGHLAYETRTTIPLIWDATTREHGFGYMDQARWNAIAQSLTRLKLLPGTAPAQGVYTDRFLPGPS